MKEVVGVVLNNTIVTNKLDLLKKYCEDYTYLIRRDVAKFMADLDLGKNWEDLANGPTLFYLDDKDKPVSLKEYKSLQ